MAVELSRQTPSSPAGGRMIGASRGASRQITFSQGGLDRRSPTAPDEFQDLAAQCIVSCIELVDHRKVIVQLHTREARACAVPFA